MKATPKVGAVGEEEAKEEVKILFNTIKSLNGAPSHRFFWSIQFTRPAVSSLLVQGVSSTYGYCSPNNPSGEGEGEIDIRVRACESRGEEVKRVAEEESGPISECQQQSPNSIDAQLSDSGREAEREEFVESINWTNYWILEIRYLISHWNI